MIFGEKRFDIVYCGSVFHLLNEANCKKLARNCFSLLGTTDPSTSPSNYKKVFFGRTMGTSKEEPFTIESAGDRFMHSKASLKALFEAAGFQDVNISNLGWHGMNLPPTHSHLTLYAFIAYLP